MDGRDGGLGRVGVVGRVIATIAIGVTAILANPVQDVAEAHLVREADSIEGASSRSSHDLEDVTAAVQTLLGKIQAARLDFLAEWPTARLQRLQVWLSYGVKFEGPWTPEELDLVLTVLDAFGATYGEARFAQLASRAIETNSLGLLASLRLIKVEGYGTPAAGWYARSGRILFNEGLFDDALIEAKYSWSFLVGDYAHPGPEVTVRQVIIGHELGHVLIDGLRVEAVAAGHDRLALEMLYEQMIEPAQWPHQGSVANENLATELAVWALGVARTQRVDALRIALSQSFPATAPSQIDPVGAAGSEQR